MRSVFRSRWIRPVLVVLAVVPTLSAVPLAPFVASGEYARALALAADCHRTFIPALDARDRAAAVPSGLVRYVGFQAAGAELAYHYRPLRLDAAAGVYERLDAADVPGVSLAPDSRLETFHTKDYAVTVASTPTAAGCVRLVLVAYPATLQVALRASDVASQQKYISFAHPGMRREYYNRNWMTTYSSTYVPAIHPEQVRGSVLVKTYADGQVTPGIDVELWTDALGDPRPYGVTYAHAHLTNGLSTVAPTILLEGQTQPGEHITLKTDYQGEHTIWVQPGYRGGPERILATATIAGRATTAVRSILVRHRDGFRYFGQEFDITSTYPPPSEDFPFVMIGYTDAHPYNHWLLPGMARKFADLLFNVWKHDAGRQKDGKPHYLALSDMSLEYGGYFHIVSGATDADSMEAAAPGRIAPHTNHAVGLDVDVSPCYTGGATGQAYVPDAECERGGHLQIDESLLALRVIGDLDGQIYEHRKTTGPNGEPADGVPYRFHIRLPPPGPFAGR